MAGSGASFRGNGSSRARRSACRRRRILYIAAHAHVGSGLFDERQGLTTVRAPWVVPDLQHDGSLFASGVRLRNPRFRLRHSLQRCIARREPRRRDCHLPARRQWGRRRAFAFGATKNPWMACVLRIQRLESVLARQPGDGTTGERPWARLARHPPSYGQRRPYTQAQPAAGS